MRRANLSTIVLFRDGAFRATMFELVCPCCSYILHYDGVKDGYFVKNNNLVCDFQFLYHIVSLLMARVTIGSCATILQNQITAFGGSFTIRRGVLANIVISFCHQIGSRSDDQVCDLHGPVSMPHAASASCPDSVSASAADGNASC